MALLDQLRDLERQVATRLKELEPMVAEYHELEQVAQRLGIERQAAQQPTQRAEAPARKPSRTRSSSRAARRRRNAAAPGSRQDDVLRLVTQRPGITVPELGRELNVDPTGLYQIVRRLEGRGELRKVGPRLEPAASAPPPFSAQPQPEPQPEPQPYPPTPSPFPPAA
jgi:DNA primase